MTPPLAGLRVLVTRPAEQAGSLCQQLAAAGAEPRELPLLAIAGTPADPALRDVFEQHRAAAGWIFTSRNAVQQARRLDPGRWQAPLYAVGAATAEALSALGHAAVIPPDEYSSEALLALPALQAVRDQSWLLVTGAGGLGLLAPTLRARGARLAVAEVYRRVPVAHPAETVARALEGCQALIVTSGEALQQLLALTPAALQPELRRRCLVLPSKRMVEVARDQGFALTVVPRHVSDAAFVHCLQQWWSAQGKP